jgi:membrane protease YdiL (CAAX protease family)
MLFLLKRRWQTSLAALFVLATVGLSLRHGLGEGPAFDVTLVNTVLALAALEVLLLSDALIYISLRLLFRDTFQGRYLELAHIFQGQTWSALVPGACLAGVGEELIFRGVSIRPVYLVGAAVLFGLLHHVRRSLWPFTVWSIWQGLLLASVVYFTGSLWVTMVAHFLHDFIGFLVFRFFWKSPSSSDRLGRGKNPNNART